MVGINQSYTTTTTTTTTTSTTNIAAFSATALIISCRVKLIK